VEQCEKDSEKCQKIPMVIFKQDRQKTLAIVPYNIIYISNNYIEIHKEEKRYKIYLFDDLLKELDSLWLD
jgi:hypothetical protein